ncbi:AAA family ATPase [Cylindrospermopsis curvispora]
MTLVLPRTYRIRCVRSQELSLVMEWYSLDTKKPLCLKELSDGTIRMLCWAIILHSPVLPSLLVIDEPELGLHVAWMRILSEWIKMAAHKTQIIIATHSPDLLDHFTDCLEKVYCFDSYGKSHFSIKKLTQEMLADKRAKSDAILWRLSHKMKEMGFSFDAPESFSKYDSQRNCVKTNYQNC